MKHILCGGVRQRGAVLAIALILLVLITLLVTGAYRMSSSNLSAVGNLQFRTHAIAAADTAIERAITGGWTDPSKVQHNVNINDPTSASVEFDVKVSRTCLNHVPNPLIAGAGFGSSVKLGPGFTPEGWQYIALFEYEAEVIDSVTGARTVVRKGLRQRLTKDECQLHCAPCD